MNAIQQEVERLNLADAIAFFAVTVHRNARGEPVPTVTVMTDEATKEDASDFHEHLVAIANILRKAYAPEGTGN